MGGKETLIENQVVFEHQAEPVFRSKGHFYRDRRPGLHGTGEGQIHIQFDPVEPAGGCQAFALDDKAVEEVRIGAVAGGN